MRLNEAAELLFPEGAEIAAPLAAVRCLAVGAHPDDLEIMSWQAVASGSVFGGVVVADGADSPRSGPYAHLTAQQMRHQRSEEQRRAAQRGGYGALVSLGYPSSAFKGAIHRGLVEDLRSVFEAASPELVFTHNPCDRHSTHVAVTMHVIAALRELAVEARPSALYGCEVWGSLDWLDGPARVTFDVSAHEVLGSELVSLFESQIAGGKRYDRAALGRRRANATFAESHAVDRATATELALDLTPLVWDPSLNPIQYVTSLFDRSRDSAVERLSPFA